MPPNRTIIVGAPQRGKSWLAAQLAAAGEGPVYCADPASAVRERLDGVTYLPEGLDFRGDRGAAAYVARCWLTLPGPWIIEGHAMARAIARYVRMFPGAPPCDRVLVLEGPPRALETPQQRRLAKQVAAEWRNVRGHAALRGRVQIIGSKPR